MDNHTQAWHYILHYKAVEIFGDFKFRTAEEVLNLWNEIATVYEEILPQLTDPSHIHFVKEVWDITKANLKAEKKEDSTEMELIDLRIDFLNAFCDASAAIQFLKKNNQSYEAKYPDVRPPDEDDEQVLEIPLLDPSVHKKMAEERVLHINDKGWINFVKTAEIYYLEAKSNYCLFYFKDASTQTFTKNLGELEPELPEVFVRVHRSFIVNAHFVEKLSRNRETLMMKDKTEIPVSKNADILLEKLRWL